MSARPYVLPCSIFGGRSQKTGKPVGERHRWPNGWGIGRCEYCGRYLDEVLRRDEPRATPAATPAPIAPAPQKAEAPWPFPASAHREGRRG